MINLNYKSDLAELIEDFSKDFLGNLNKAENQILVFYSGGSVLDLLNEIFSRTGLDEIVCRKIVFAPVDERFDYINSNYLAFKNMPVYEKLVNAGAKFVDTALTKGSVEDAAKWYDQWVRGEIKRIRVVKGKIISILGMGSDGHTASFFPYRYSEKEIFKKLFIDTDKYVVGYDAGNRNQYRLRFTLTLPALKESDTNFAFVSGGDKKEKLVEVLASESDVNEVPARIWYLLNNLNLYTDIDSSS